MKTVSQGGKLSSGVNRAWVLTTRSGVMEVIRDLVKSNVGGQVRAQV